MRSELLTLSGKGSEEYGYRLAHRLAVEALARIEDIEEQCRRCGVRYLRERQAIELDYLNRSYLIAHPGGQVTLENADEEVSLLDKILLLHYVTQAKGTPLSGQLISFKELPEGTNYFRTYYQRAIRPLATYFGEDPDRFMKTAALLGGKKSDYGDVSATIEALSRVPLTLVLWRGDTEFSAEASIMFDRTITDYLPTEDIIFICQSTSWRLVKLFQAGGDS
jgi:hypothetical protein